MTIPGCDEKYINMLREIILSTINTEKVMVFLFGSSASGSHSLRTDVDIGLLTDEKFPLHLFHKIQNAVEDSIIPLQVDIVDFTRVSPSFRAAALKDIVIWNKPKGMNRSLSH